MTLGVVRALGWLVIAHGLSHAVLPLRGSIAPAYVIDDWIPVGLYMIGMIGFVVAGLGMLGLRPMDAVICPVLVLSSGLSLVAISRLGDPTLWVGGLVDVPLLVAGVWRAYAGWPTHPRHGRVWHVLGLACGFAFLAYVATAVVLWPWHRTWGSTRDELAMALPGDTAMTGPEFPRQHAVTIEAPPEAVWPWLMQLGQDRARDVGGPLRLRPGWNVTALDPPRAMVLDQRGAFVLLPTANGGTRFIIRSRFGSPTFPVWAAGLQLLAFELPHFVIERRMMLTIKALAEQHHNLRASAH